MRLALLLPLAAPALAEPVVPRFVDETAASGVESAYEGGWAYMVGGGVAAFDCSGDLRPELAFAGGERPASLWLNRTPVGGPLAFERGRSGIEMEAVTGLYPLDVEGDGLLDLMVLRNGESLLMRGLGGCRFEEAPASWGFERPEAWATAFAATWERGRDWPTLAVGTYIDPAEEFFPWGSCTDNLLYRPERRAFAAPLPLRPGHCALSMLFTDWARAGAPDLRVSNDREYYKGGSEQLWRMTDPPTPYTEAEGWRTLRIWGMGIAGRDLDGDGLQEYALTSMADNKLQALVLPQDGPLLPTYADVAFARGAIAQRPYTGGDVRPSTAWHVEWADVNADALPDLFIAKGNVSEMPDFAQADPNNLLLLREDGTFVEAGLEAGVASMRQARGAALVDLDLDGRLDLVVANRNAGAELWRNETEGGRWLQVRLEMPGANRDAVGAFVEVRAGGRTQSREVTVGGGHAGGQMGWWHFGLGGAGAAEVRVLWPDGTEGPWQRVEADGFVRLSPGAEPRPWEPG